MREVSSLKILQILIREYYEQVYANKFNNLDEMEKFLSSLKLPSLRKKK